MKSLSSFLQDSTGAFSSGRMVLVCIMLELVAERMFVTIKTGKPEPLDWQTISTLLGMFTFSVVKTRVENPVGLPADKPSIEPNDETLPHTQAP